MIFHFYSSQHFEPWDYRNPLSKGIGGSETAHIECAIRLAKRGHQVYSYSPLPKDCPKGYNEENKVFWYDLKDAEFWKPGIWVMGRSVKELDKFPLKHPGKKIWLVMQDVFYPLLTKKRAAKLDLLLPLCQEHIQYTMNIFPEFKDRIVKSANGIRSDILAKLSSEVRDPHRMMYASSPDRGLITLLRIFPKIKKKIPDASLHIFYGLDNILKLGDERTPIDAVGNTVGDLLELTKQQDVFWRGRIGQMELYSEWLKTGVWAYPTRFSETSCITSMEAQALGAIPITNPFWALKDNIMCGSLIDGDPLIDGLTQIRYIEEVCYWMGKGWENKYLNKIWNKEIESIREKMMKNSRYVFTWERVVDQYERLAS